ncbi:hypothetical protein HELRODRAFT_158922 [Helobdella robusta]|uniref:Uncharacterized protein n=1 Tax=Helobdella robusta TaxID=6412 RepID=T1ENE6_HELRO|nr:hypothetical protein HELRODRAFT_158922 [Helobdella robusta]ESO12401.1 hypothetical protein HELRODRAFT_158922 [Helobdella robusta]
MTHYKSHLIGKNFISVSVDGCAWNDSCKSVKAMDLQNQRLCPAHVKTVALSRIELRKIEEDRTIRCYRKNQIQGSQVKVSVKKHLVNNEKDEVSPSPQNDNGCVFACSKDENSDTSLPTYNNAFPDKLHIENLPGYFNLDREQEWDESKNLRSVVSGSESR